mmetsp:Transcript_30604/g.46197  ORF Transcript_30604/g.46197 Transcript_30604/m.46197 type:complete len:216 (-) Transcript_30604:154-801(-)
MAAYSAARLKELLRHFELPPAATQAELRKAYYAQAKMLHPDIAGKESADEFRDLKATYEEALNLIREFDNYPHLRHGQWANGGNTGAAGPAGFGEGPYTDWTDATGRWSRDMPRGHWHGHSETYTTESVNFDPRAFREKQRSHTTKGEGKSYSYEAAGRGSSFSNRQAQYGSGSRNREWWTPAQCFRYSLTFAGGMLAGSKFLQAIAIDPGKMYH